MNTYRFVLLKGMPMAERIQCEKAKEWGLPPPTKNWDIIDLKEKKFM